jgi:GNAT superfamily N-acetyltransferase
MDRTDDHPDAMRIVAINHPSLIASVDHLLAELRAEKRYFGRPDGWGNKPYPSLIARLAEPSGLRMGAIEASRVVALANVNDEGEVAMAIVADRRGCGIGADLLAALLRRAERVGFRRLVLPTTRRSPALLTVADRLGAVAVEVGQGAVDLIFDVDRCAQLA